MLLQKLDVWLVWGTGEELLIYYGLPDKLWFEDPTAPSVSSSSDEGSDGGLSRLQL